VPFLSAASTLVNATAEQPDGKPFSFKYDAEGDVLGAGTAFLQD